MVREGVITAEMVGRWTLGAVRDRPGGSLPPVDVPDRIEVNDGAALQLTWPDGSTTSLGAAELRNACECATCQAEASGAVGDPNEIRIVETAIVGAYALNFTFAPDQHHTGIYPFDRLRALGEAG